ncbi:Chymotrypsin BII [Frankliniella fusca]|uniref:Chymotrypsin BII n=1 Tax=Frankliniella fusca TaxID=407009 RepID=A0AAE1HCI5_9NEOP|nr:Chymotrypsin BII [Frankliniella fusca]
MKTVLLVCAALLAGVASAASALPPGDAQAQEFHLAKKMTVKQAALSPKAGLKIYNGLDAKPGQFPSYVAMYVNMDSFCGGSLIHPKWVLTAAHCVEAGSLWTLFLGALSLQLPKEAGRQIHVTRAAYTHPDYVRYGDFENDDIYLNDVGLIQLPEPVQMPADGRIGVVKLPDPTTQLVLSSETVVPGFGVVGDEVNVLSRTLKFTKLPLASSDLCYNYYGIADPSIICVNTVDVRASTCGGDDGGPMIQMDDTGVSVQVGITSFWARIGCTVGSPVGFTSVAQFVPWIEEATGMRYPFNS